jgi:soluble lytic murein transglycosylase-like protein
MRSSIPKDDMGGESYGGDMLEGMFDGELARYVSHGSNLGLGEMLYKEITGEEMPRANTSAAAMPRFAAPEVRGAVPAVTPMVPRPAITPAVVTASGETSPAGAENPAANGGASNHTAPASPASNTPASSTPAANTAVPTTPVAPVVREQIRPREVQLQRKKVEPGAAPATVSAPPDTIRRRLEALDPIIRTAADTTGVNASLLRAVIATESGGRMEAKSSRNAKGLMQLIDSTATAMGVRNVWDPLQNVQGGARYLGQMMDRFGGNLEHALASYNAGPGAVEKHKGVPPYRETQNYVGKVLEYLRYFEQQETGSDDQD